MQTQTDITTTDVKKMAVFLMGAPRPAVSEETLEMDVPFNADELIDEYERDQYMSPADLSRLTTPVARLEIIDPMVHQPKITACLRTRVVTLLRVLLDDVATLHRNQTVSWDDLVSAREVAQYGSILNALVWRDHTALVATLRAIKHCTEAEQAQYHDAFWNLGFLGGIQTKERVIRLRHPSMFIGQIVV